MGRENEREIFRQETDASVSVRHRRSGLVSNAGRGVLLVRYSDVLGLQSQAPFVGVYPIPNDIKGLGLFSVRNRPSPSLICFRRFASHAFPRMVIPVSVSVCLTTWRSVRLVTRSPFADAEALARCPRDR